MVDQITQDGTDRGVLARTMSNLLGSLNNTPTGGGESSSKQPGVYVGDGLPPVPAKLAAKITHWEFIEMHELVPEFWAEAKGDDGARKGGGQREEKSDGDPGLAPMFCAVCERDGNQAPGSSPRAHGLHDWYHAGQLRV